MNKYFSNVFNKLHIFVVDDILMEVDVTVNNPTIIVNVWACERVLNASRAMQTSTKFWNIKLYAAHLLIAFGIILCMHVSTEAIVK